MTDKKSLGNLGEVLAAKYMADKGYATVARNYRAEHGEIDIICRNSERTVFAEVKTRKLSQTAFSRPASAVNAKKREHILSAVREYLSENPIDGRIRIDVIEVYTNGDEYKIVHMENAFGE